MHTIEQATEGRWQQGTGRGLIRCAAPLRRRRAGFTMLELLVAISVLLVATAAAFGSQIASFGLIGSSRDSSTAMTDLEVCMEDLLSGTATEMVVAFPAGQPIAAFDGLHLRDEVITPSYPGWGGVGALPDPVDVVLTATWSDGRGRPQRLMLSTQVAR